MLKAYPNNLSIRYILISPKEVKVKGIAGMFDEKQSTWSGWSGFITKSKVQEFLNENAVTGKKQKICNLWSITNDGFSE